MIYLSSYKTTGMAGWPLDNIEKNLEIARLNGSAKKFNENYAGGLSVPYYFDGEDDVYILDDPKSLHTRSIPSLRHPYPLYDHETGKTRMFIDVRTLTAYDSTNDLFRIKASNRMDAEALFRRAYLELLWLTQPPTDMRNQYTTLPAVLFSRWVASRLKQTLMLDEREQMAIEIVTAYYYYGLFETGTPDKDKVVSMISRYMGLDAKMAYDVLDSVGSAPLTNIHKLCDAYRQATESIRLKGFDAGILTTALGMSYSGQLGRELIGVALEHPPTWLTMVYYAYIDTFYSKTVIGKMMERGSMRDQGQAFCNAFVSAFSQSTD